MFADEGVPWACYGEHSGFYFFLNPAGEALDPMTFEANEVPLEALKASGKHPAAAKLRLALMLNGMDLSGKPGGTVSAAHTESDIAASVDAVRSAIHLLHTEEEL